MSGAMRRFRRRASARPKAAAILVLALAAAAGMGAWVARGTIAAPHVQLTSLRPRRPAKPPAPHAPPARRETLRRRVAAYRGRVGVAAPAVPEGGPARVAGGSRYPQQSVVK